MRRRRAIGSDSGLGSAAPEQPVVGEHQLRAAGDGALSDSRFAETAVAIASTSGRPGTWSPFGAVVVERAGVEQLVAERDDLVARGHGTQRN